MSRLVLKLRPMETQDAVYLDAWDSEGRPVRIAIESLDKAPVRIGLIAPRSVKIQRAKLVSATEGIDLATVRDQTEAAAK
jgi:sRNA-binding carbon storage regulator CsrA